MAKRVDGEKRAVFINDREKAAAFTNKNPSLENFGFYLDIWLSSSKLHLKESSYVKYHQLICNHIKPELGKFKPAAITSKNLAAFAGNLLNNGRSDAGDGLSSKTIRDILSIIKAVLEHSHFKPLNDIKIPLPREAARDIRVFSKREQSLLERFLNEDMDESKLGVFFCLYTGLRIGEVCALVWKDINLENKENTVTVRRTMQRIQMLDIDSEKKTKIIITNPKSRSSVRTIPLPERLVEALAPFQPANPRAYVLTGEEDKYIEPRSYANKFKSYLSGSGIKDANFHCTRHTFATRCVELGFDPKTLSEILGHSDVRVTMDKYVHPSLELKRSSMDKLNGLW